MNNELEMIERAWTRRTYVSSLFGAPPDRKIFSFPYEKKRRIATHSIQPTHLESMISRPTTPVMADIWRRWAVAAAVRRAVAALVAIMIVIEKQFVIRQVCLVRR